MFEWHELSTVCSLFPAIMHADSSLTPSMRRDYYRGSTDSLADRQRSEERQSRMRPGRSYSLVRGEACLCLLGEKEKPVSICLVVLVVV